MKKTLITLFTTCSLIIYGQVYVPIYELLTVSGTDTYTVTKTPTPSLTNGLKFEAKFTNANTGASTLNVNSTGAVTLRKFDGTALSSGDIAAGSVWWVTYDATASQYRLLGGGGGVTSITASAPLTGGTITTTGTIGITQSTTSTDGYLSSTDWNTFNSKQSAISFGTGVQTALGVNIGSAGAPVLFNGAAGTPSSMVGTNITGTASGLTAGTVTTNANMTGPVTSSGNITSTQFVTPEQFGAVGDGSTNDQAALQSCVDAGKPCFIGLKNYRTTTSVTLSDNAKIIGAGFGSIISTTSNISVLVVAGSNTVIESLTILGNNTGAAQRGISVVGVSGLTTARNNNRITNVTVSTLTYGVYAQYSNITGSIHYGSIKAVNVVAISCTNGFYMDTRAEYNTFSNCSAITNTTGLYMGAGNVSWNGGQITDNTTGVSLAAGTNDGHSVMSGTMINHNTTAISANGITASYLFSNCMIYIGNVTIVSSTGIKFHGCDFSTLTTFTSTNNTDTEIFNCKFVTTPTWTITGTAPLFFNNKYMAGTIPTSSALNTLTGRLSFTYSSITGGDVTNNFSRETGTMPSTMTASTAGKATIITGAGSSSFTNVAEQLQYLAGYTGSSPSIARYVFNSNAGTNTGAPRPDQSFGNNAILAGMQSTTAGHNYGVVGVADGGALNTGVIGVSQIAKAAATNYGLVGVALNTTSNFSIGVHGALVASATALPTGLSAAALFNNGSTTGDILRLEDNGTPVWQVVDGGTLTAAEGINIAVGTSTGTKIGTSTSQKLSFYNSTPIVQPTGNIKTALSNLGLVASPTIASDIVGTATNDNATAGNIGEHTSSLIAIGSAVSLTTATPANITSISLTAGDWDVTGAINFTEGSATVTVRTGGINTTTATLPTDGTEVENGTLTTVLSTKNSVTIPRKRISIAGTTTVYLVASSTFSAGTVAGYGQITARRVR